MTLFARRGADCLGKWSGDAERSLRLLFSEVRAKPDRMLSTKSVDYYCHAQTLALSLLLWHTIRIAVHCARWVCLIASRPQVFCLLARSDTLLNVCLVRLLTLNPTTSLPTSFEQAAKRAPAIIFLDELDGLVPSRAQREGGQDQVFASVVSTLLALMDGLHDRGRVVVIGATNRCMTSALA